MNTIVVYLPMYRLNKVLDEYGASFNAIEWGMRSVEYEHPQFGTCDSLWIEKTDKWDSNGNLNPKWINDIWSITACMSYTANFSKFTCQNPS